MSQARILFVLIVAGIIVVYLISIVGPLQLPASSGAGTATMLPSVEIREYQGQKLTAAADFPENSIKGPQIVPLDTYRLRVYGLVNQEREYTYDAVLANHTHYSKVVTLHCVEGWDATVLWEEILVKDLLQETGIQPRTNTIIFHAYDGYTTSFPLSYVTDRDIIMAYRINNETLPAARGFPFALVAEDKWGYKWIRWITGIELSDNPDYRGYWEQRGYSNSGNLSQSFFFG